MAVSKEDLIETLSNMSILEVTELVADLEDKWGVSAAAAVAAPVAIVEGAGGSATDWCGRPLTLESQGRTLFLGNPVLLNSVVDLLQA